MAKKGNDPVTGAVTDGTYSNLATPLNVPKASEDPQAQLDNSVFPGAKGQDHPDPMKYMP